MAGLEGTGTRLPKEGRLEIKPPKRDLTVLESDHTVLGWCPVASPKTVCCNLRTLDAVQGCGMGCSWQYPDFYDDRKVGVDGQLMDN